MKKVLFMIMIVMCCASCALTKPWPQCNQNIASGSMLRGIADEYEVCLEDVGNTLIIANSVAIGFGKLYTREQAREAVETWIVMLKDNAITYSEFRSDVYKKLSMYPGLFEVADIYFNRFVQVNIPILPEDRELLISWLETRVLPILQEPSFT